MYNFFNIKNRFSNGKRKILFWLLFFLGFVLGAMNSIGEFIACAKKKKNCIVCATLLYGRLEIILLDFITMMLFKGLSKFKQLNR
jgi:hypothetical protein